MRIKEEIERFHEIFGKLDKTVIATDEEIVSVGDTAILINSNCEFDFDNITGRFEDNPLYYYIVDLEPVEMYLGNYIPEESNNGGRYGFAECIIKKIHEKSY